MKICIYFQKHSMLTWFSHGNQTFGINSFTSLQLPVIIVKKKVDCQCFMIFLFHLKFGKWIFGESVNNFGCVNF